MKKIRLRYLVLVVFCISWLGILPSLLISHGIKIPSIFKNLELLMTLGPLTGALAFIGIVQGKAGLTSFLRRLFKLKAPLLVIIITICLPILISMLASVIGLNISNSGWPRGFTSHEILSNGIIVFAIYLIINTEELVWRGIVFEQLLRKYSYIRSCVILAPVWWLFHLPLFLYPNGHQAGCGLIEFTFMVIALTFILGWVYLKTSRSLFYVHIQHQLFNGFGQAFPIFPIFIGGKCRGFGCKF